MRIPIFDDAVLEAPGGNGLGAEVGVARPGLAARGRGLQQKAERPASQLGVRGYGSIGIQQDFAPHRHKPCACTPRLGHGSSEVQEPIARLVRVDLLRHTPHVTFPDDATVD